MELRSYWRVLRRRRWVVLGVTLLALIAAVVSVAALPQPLPTYQATVVIAVSPTNIPPPANNPYGDYYHYIASEYLNDDIMAIVESGSFNRVVSARYAGRPEGPPSASIKGKKAHRVVTFTVSADRRSDALDVAQGIIDLLREPRPGEPRYLDQFTEQQPRVAVIQDPELTVQPGVRRGAFDVGVRTLLGLIIGIALAFLLHYLDDTVQDGREAELYTGLPLLAEIPRPGRERLRAKAGT
ncbi:MAG TPA: Wzz/FepE/Etk N-terminal domain-containing protein [Chloroflexota bacterium]|nr:Wzz/FepE/Etk N-terminal domain-containing protein [Chloroflexota bacterium]